MNAGEFCPIGRVRIKRTDDMTPTYYAPMGSFVSNNEGCGGLFCGGEEGAIADDGTIPEAYAIYDMREIV